MVLYISYFTDFLYYSNLSWFHKGLITQLANEFNNKNGKTPLYSPTLNEFPAYDPTENLVDKTWDLTFKVLKG